MPVGSLGILREWVAAYGLPALPDPGQTYRQNIDLTIGSFLDVAWDEQAQGWHHTLADPWGPRFEPLLANQLWRYSRWAEGDPVQRARARDQVRRAIPRAVEKLPAPWNIPQLELSLVYGQVAGALDAAAEAARQAMADQQADGSWGWTPAAVADIADFKNPERLAVLGKDKDCATGFTANKVIPVLKYALCTGNADAVGAARRAADWCNTQRRPEGAQTWELHLHVPDVLAAPWLMNLNLGVYQLTGDEHYLEAANRWAWTGLPFTFLWNSYYRPIMCYGTIPVFGVTFHDVQVWFGVIVHWNGLWYADALFRLATFRPTDGPIDWAYLAEGITRHGMQEQIKEGPYKGMYPDAFSTVKGDEDYVWWLNPQLIGLNTLPLAGLPVNADPMICAGVHVTSGATIIRASRDASGNLALLLNDQRGEVSYTAIAGGGRPAKILCEGIIVSESNALDTDDQGWQWLAAHRVAIVKVRHEYGALNLRCQFES